MKNSLIAEILDILKTIVIAFIFGLIISNFIISNAIVPSGSMEDTVREGSLIIINRTAYWFKSPERGDIVTFPSPDEPETLFLKRVIGLPGDTIEIKGHQLYINGAAYKEDYIKITHDSLTDVYGPYTVPNGYYFLLGDNRDNSFDARFWENRYVHEDTIIGKAAFQYYPKLKLFKDMEYIELN